MVSEPFNSHFIIPCVSYCMRTWIRECEAAKKRNDSSLETACINFWWGMNAIHNLSCSTPGAVNFSIAAMNELRNTRNYIQAILKVDPETDQRFCVPSMRNQQKG